MPRILRLLIAFIGWLLALQCCVLGFEYIHFYATYGNIYYLGDIFTWFGSALLLLLEGIIIIKHK